MPCLPFAVMDARNPTVRRKSILLVETNNESLMSGTHSAKKKNEGKEGDEERPGLAKLE